MQSSQSSQSFNPKLQNWDKEQSKGHTYMSMKLSAQWCAPKVCITSRFHHCLLSIEPPHWHMIQNQIKRGTQMVVFLCWTLLHRNGAWCQTSLLESFLVPVSQDLQKWELSQVLLLFYPFGELFSNHNFCHSIAQTCRILDFTLSIDETFQKLVMKPPLSTSTSSRTPWEWTLQNHGSTTECFSSRCMYITFNGNTTSRPLLPELVWIIIIHY